MIMYYYISLSLHSPPDITSDQVQENGSGRACSTHGYVVVDWTHLAQERGHAECDLKAHSGILARDLHNNPCSYFEDIIEVG
jgi:hypothetical protein